MKYYQRIDINGDPERLPKEKGTYMICNRQSFYMQTRFNPKLQESKRVWLKEVIWWEQPCGLPEPDKRDELIKKYRNLVAEIDKVFELKGYFVIGMFKQRRIEIAELEKELT